MKLTILSLALLPSVLSAPAPAADPEAFPISELLSSSLTPEAHALSKRQYSSSTYNQLTDGTACRAISVIYARGTSQQGNVGDAAAVGPLFFNQIASRVGGTSKLAIQGVTYSASVLGFLQGGDAAGSTTMTNLISSVSPARGSAVERERANTIADSHQVSIHQDCARGLQSGCAARPQRRSAHIGGKRCSHLRWYICPLDKPV